MAPQQDIDPAGDVVLMVGEGEDQKSTRVSSKVLSLASSVFAAMLSPRFAEGIALQKGGSSATTPISLPDDDPEAVLWVCEALHFRKRITEKRSFPLFKKLALLCDKYDLSQALGSWSQTWMLDICKWLRFNPHASIEMLGDCLWVSYGFGHQRAFWQSSRHMACFYIGAGDKGYQPRPGYHILPQSVTDSIIATHNDSMQRYRAAIEDVIVPLLQHNCPAKDQHETHTQSCEHLSAIGHSLQQLFNIGLWPTSNIDQMSTSIVSSKIDEFRNYERSPAAEYYLEGEHYIGCDSLRMDIKQRLLEATKEALEKTKGLCLSCVKRGKVTSEEGNCHAEEEILCSEHMEHVAITNAV